MIPLTLAAPLAALCALAPVPQERGPQDPRDAKSLPTPQLSVVTGALRGTLVHTGRLGYGDGGLEEAAPGTTLENLGDGYRTPGGARVRARHVGLQVACPNGMDLAIDDRGSVVLRDGSRTREHPRGVRLWLTDGSFVEALVDRRRDEPLRRVRVGDGISRPVVFWKGRDGDKVREREEQGADDLLVLGDGRAIYRAVAIGPFLVLERVLAPRALLQDRTPHAVEPLPERAVVLLGDVLAIGQLRVGQHARVEAANRPELFQRAEALSGLTQRILPPGQRFVRPETGREEPIVAVGAGFRLEVRTEIGRPLAVNLWAPNQDAPILEWSYTNETIVHLITVESDQRAHYAMQGLRLGSLGRRTLPYPTTSTVQGRARRVIHDLEGPPLEIATTPASAGR